MSGENNGQGATRGVSGRASSEFPSQVRSAHAQYKVRVQYVRSAYNDSVEEKRRSRSTVPYSFEGSYENGMERPGSSPKRRSPQRSGSSPSRRSPQRSGSSPSRRSPQRPGSPQRSGSPQRAAGNDKVTKSLGSTSGVGRTQRTTAPLPTDEPGAKESRKGIFRNIGAISEEMKLYMGNFGKVQQRYEDSTETTMYEEFQKIRARLLVPPPERVSQLAAPKR
eukprot:5332921-Pyramimonas_sp.AAC.1